MARVLLGIDIGTTNSKGVLVDIKGNVLSSETVTHTISSPRPDWAEQDPAIWWEEFKHICRALFSKSGITPQDIIAIGCSGMMPTVVPLDERGNHLRPAILYGIDSRAGEEIKLIDSIQTDISSLGERKPLTSQSAAPKVLWIKRNEPEVFEKTETIVSTVGFLVYRLTGMPTIDIPTAMEYNPLFNLEKMAWDSNWCKELGIVERVLPLPLPAMHVVGGVSPQAAAETGLRLGTPVVVGSGDVLADRLAMGMTEPGDAAVTYGTTMTVSIIPQEFKSDPRLLCGPYVIPGLYRIAGAMNTSGALIDWMYRTVGPTSEAGDWRRDLEFEAARVEPGSEGLLVLPYFSGERTPLFDDQARGVIAGLTLRHTKAHLLRASLEATAYALLHNLEVMGESGYRPAKVVSTGGGTRSRLWLQIVSDVTGVEQQILDHQWGAPLGAAFLAGIGVGLVADFKEAKEWTKCVEVIWPEPRRTAIYQAYYQNFRQLYQVTQEQIYRLGKLATTY